MSTYALHYAPYCTRRLITIVPASQRFHSTSKPGFRGISNELFKRFLMASRAIVARHKVGSHKNHDCCPQSFHRARPLKTLSPPAPLGPFHVSERCLLLTTTAALWPILWRRHSVWLSRGLNVNLHHTIVQVGDLLFPLSILFIASP